MEEGQCFDEAAMRHAAEFATKAMQEIPEIRGVIVVFDYQKELNHVAKAGNWWTRSGTYVNPIELSGSVEQVSKLIAKMQETVINFNMKLIERTVELLSKEKEGAQSSPDKGQQTAKAD